MSGSRTPEEQPMPPSRSSAASLLPCPFCGGTPETFISHFQGHRALCRNCQINMPVDGWQDRSMPSETQQSDDYIEALKQNIRLRKALEQCVNVAKTWHGDDAFDLYFNHSPEMKLIRDVLGKMPEDA